MNCIEQKKYKVLLKRRPSRSQEIYQEEFGRGLLRTSRIQISSSENAKP
jgi:hypothetical protein